MAHMLHPIGQKAVERGIHQWLEASQHPQMRNADAGGTRNPYKCEDGAYLARFHTNGMAAPVGPPDGMGLVYLRSSPVTEKLVRF